MFSLDIHRQIYLNCLSLNTDKWFKLVESEQSCHTLSPILLGLTVQAQLDLCLQEPARGRGLRGRHALGGRDQSQGAQGIVVTAPDTDLAGYPANIFFRISG